MHRPRKYSSRRRICRCLRPLRTKPVKIHLKGWPSFAKKDQATFSALASGILQEGIQTFMTLFLTSRIYQNLLVWLTAGSALCAFAAMLPIKQSIGFARIFEPRHLQVEPDLKHRRHPGRSKNDTGKRPKAESVCEYNAVKYWWWQ